MVPATAPARAAGIAEGRAPYTSPRDHGDAADPARRTRTPARRGGVQVNAPPFGRDDGPVLVVAAHPDDETLGAGGTIARLTRAGTAVSLLVLAGRTTSRCGAADGGVGHTPEHLQRAAERLGVSDVEAHSFPDNRLDTVASLEVARVIEQTMTRVRPTVVITHHGGDANVDHRVAHRAAVVATRPQPGHPVHTVLAFETPSSTEWAFDPTRTFDPQVFVDITETLETKLEALACYRDELRPAPHPRSIEACRALARWRGSTVGVTAAEAFRLVRHVV